MKLLAPFVLAHRLLLTPDARLRGATAEDVLANLLRSVPVSPEI